WRARLGVADGLAPGAGVPGVVVDEDAYAEPLDRLDELVDPGDVAVEVELIALVDPDYRVGVPEDDGIPAAELALGLVEEPVGREAAGLVVVEEVVPEPDEGARKAALRPGEGRQVVRRAVVPRPHAGRVGPRRRTLPPGGPVGRVVGRGKDLGAVEHVERPLERDPRVHVERPRDERVERLAHKRARVRAANSSSPIPSRPGSDVA